MTAREDDPMNGRTHEPSLRELTAELDGVRDLMEANFLALSRLYDERDRRYTERDASRQTEVANALIATKEQTAAAFASSKEAIAEAKKAQDAYNASHNDLLRKMERQASEMVTRQHLDDIFKGIDARVIELRDTVTKGGGAQIGQQKLKDESRATLAILISIVGMVMVLAGTVATFIHVMK